MLIEEMEAAVSEANIIINNSKTVVGKMARLCTGRLRDSDTPHWILEKLKRELKNYNIHTGTWKD